jgi:HNH endonuclease
MTRLRACIVCGVVLLGTLGPRCSECRRLFNRRYNATRPELHGFYATPAWRRLSEEVRAGATRCSYCLAPTARLVVDHIVPLDQRPDLGLERSNLAVSCYGCNRRRAVNARKPDLQSQAPAQASGRGGPFGSGRSEPREADPTSRPAVRGLADAERTWT